MDQINQNEINNLFNSSLNFEGKSPSKVGFYSFEEKLIFEDHYPFNTSIRDLIKDFVSKIHDKTLLNFLGNKKNIKKQNLYYYIKNNDKYEILDIGEKLISDYLAKIQDTTLMIMQGGKLSYSTGSLESIPEANRFLKIYVKGYKIYNFIPQNIDQYIINNCYLIGKLIMNELKYYVYNKNSSEIKIMKCPKDKIRKMKIKYFSRKSVYCNAKNNLYIYEGNDDLNENNYNNDNNFFEINLINNEINIISTKFPKRILHSMIFIPECYIFIVGGKYTKEVLTYDLKENKGNYEKYPYLLVEELLEPSLITINNKYLYAFENSAVRFHILRTDLLNVTPFEEIKINNIININQKFFGLVKNKSRNAIIFLGGQIISSNYNNNTKNIFEYDYSTNKINISQREFQNFDFTEKSFIPMVKNAYMQIAELKYENKYLPKIIIFYENNSIIPSEIIHRMKKTPPCNQKIFETVETDNLKITISDNTNNPVGNSSSDEMPVPLYNN